MREQQEKKQQAEARFAKVRLRVSAIDRRCPSFHAGFHSRVIVCRRRERDTAVRRERRRRKIYGRRGKYREKRLDPIFLNKAVQSVVSSRGSYLIQAERLKVKQEIEKQSQLEETRR